MLVPLNKLMTPYKGIPKEIWILAIAMFINRVGSMVLLFMSVYLTKEKHFSIPEAGWIMSLFGIGSLFGAYFGGKLVDRIGFYPILIWSLILCGSMLIVLGQCAQFELIAIFTFLVSATGDAFRPANTTSISTYANSASYTQSIALNRLAMNVGFMFGPVFGGILASLNYQFIFWVDGATCIFSGLFIALMLSNPRSKKSIQKTTPAQIHAQRALSDKVYLRFLFFTCLYATAFFQMITILPLYFEKNYQLKESTIGFIMGLNGLGVAVIEMFLIYYIKNKWSQFKFIALGIAFLILSCLILIPFHHVSILIISIIFMTFSEMFAMPLMSTFAMNKAPKANMGEYMGLYSISWSVAQIISPLLGTHVIDAYGFNWLWICLALLCAISFVGFNYMEKNKLAYRTTTHELS